jgi:diaminobutyrate-2-oxoglutarate transaminase
LTGNRFYHSEFYGSRNNVTHLPFDGYSADVDSARLLAKMLEDSSSGIPIPAAIILETIQGEGGVNVASDHWLREIASICRQHGIVLIIDDIQVGNGRTGKFFSFEHAGIKPDVVCLSKSIGGGLPMSIVLIAPEMDVWKPGQHTGTFRGNNLAFVAAAAVLKNWADPSFESGIQHRSEIIHDKLINIQKRYCHHEFDVRGRGMIWGLDIADGTLARKVIDGCFANGLLLEASGADDQVLKVMPALTIPVDLLKHGLEILSEVIARTIDTDANAKEDSASASRPAMPNLGFTAGVNGISMPVSPSGQ